MRKHFSTYIEKRADNDLVFITGDLGYNALENVKEKLGKRFINAGVAEQNMIGIAAGMASQGFRVICYSIAPFVVYRCLEQIRNDVCFHNLPVYIVGNGGGYGYGIMGSSHHAIEDLATLGGLPNMTCYVPSFVEDLNWCLDEMFEKRQPAYLRLGTGKQLPDYLKKSAYGAGMPENKESQLTLIAQGPVAGNATEALSKHPLRNAIELFIINRMPLPALPEEIISSIRRNQNVLIVEEHVATGGLSSAFSLLLKEAAIPVNQFKSLRAHGYPNNLYGSQAYHQKINGLDAENISNTINSFF